MNTRMGAGAEFDVIRAMLERWGTRASGLGDDAAVITSMGDDFLVVSTDTSVENVHFRREWLAPQEISYRAAAAALSDLAAMGATPIGLLVALTVPKSWQPDLDSIAEGIGEAAEVAGTVVIGGDTTQGRELSLTITVLGTSREVLYRSRAQAGHSIYVTGRLGGPLAALRDLKSRRPPLPEYRARFAHPVPRIREAVWLADHGASAAIDISDGLAADLGHIAAASAVHMTVRMEDLPLMTGVSARDAAGSGEEYELLVTARDDVDTHEFTTQFAVELTKIGTVSAGPAGVVMTSGGEPVSVPAGYLHFTQ